MNDTPSPLSTAFVLTGMTLLRNRVALTLFVVLPVLFYLLIVITTTDAPVAFTLAAVSADTMIEVSRREEALVFMGLAAVGFISAFLGFYLISRQTEVSRRLLLCGYRSWQVVATRLAVLGCAIVAVSLFCGALLLGFFVPRHVGNVVLGFVLVGTVYGCYGLLAGSIFRRELEGVLSIVLLTNIDVAWLQNPIFYTESKNTPQRATVLRWIRFCLTASSQTMTMSLGAPSASEIPSTGCWKVKSASQRCWPRNEWACAASRPSRWSRRSSSIIRCQSA